MTFSDDFTGTNGQHVSDRSGWTLVKAGSHDLEIQSNAATVHDTEASASGVESIYFCTSQGANQYTQVADVGHFTSISNVMAMVRCSTDGNYFVGCRNETPGGGAGMKFRKRVAGTYSTIIGFSTSAGTVLKVEASDNHFTCYKGGAAVGSQSVTAVSAGQGTGQGFWLRDGAGFGSAWYDDFEAGRIGEIAFSVVSGSLKIKAELINITLPDAVLAYAVAGSMKFKAASASVRRQIAYQALAGQMKFKAQSTDHVRVYLATLEMEKAVLDMLGGAGGGNSVLHVRPVAYQLVLAGLTPEAVRGGWIEIDTANGEWSAIEGASPSLVKLT